jgi:hypothetical protein
VNQIKAIYQTDPEFVAFPNIRKSACYLLFWYDLAWMYFNIDYTHQAIIDFLKREWGDGDEDIDEEMLVGNPQNLIDDLVGKGRVKFIGRKPTDYKADIDEVVCGVWHRIGTDFNHFVTAEKPNYLRVQKDPWSAEGSLSVSKGNLIGLRIAKIIKPLKA